jgi:PBSX family phage terminase large subunit
VTIETDVYSNKFYDLLATDARYVIAYGSRGSGKTYTIVLKLLALSFLKKYNHILYINKEFRHIKIQQFAEFKKVAKLVGLYEYFTFYDGDYRIVNNITGTRFTPIGMDDPEKTKGISDPTVIWWDEITKGTQEDFLTLNALLRTPLNPKHQFIISFNPVSENHWIRKYFFDEKDAYRLNDSFKNNTLLHHSTFRDNEFIDQEAYCQTLLQNAHGNTNRMLVDIEGKWGVDKIDNPFFYAFREDLHYTDSRYSLIDNSLLYLSFDFNANPTTLLIGQLNGKQIAVIDLILGDENTMAGRSPLEAVCLKFKEKYLDTGMITRPYIVVTGDASGRSKSADNVANKNFYSKIKLLLGIGDSQIKVRKANVTHDLSREICNSMIYACDFMIYKSAYLVVHDMNQAYIDDRGTLNKAKEEHGLHITDALRYLIDCVLNFEKWQDYIRHLSRK